MKTSESIDILVSCNGKRGLKKALLYTAICLTGIVYYLDFDSPHIRRTFGQFLMPIMASIALYFWVRYLKEKQQYLRVTEQFICWGQNGKMQTIEWSKVQHITLLDLATISGRAGIILEFTMTGSLSAKPTLNVEDYSIEPTCLASIVRELAGRNGFAVCCPPKT